ncbi:MAG: hypothetical protein PHU21_03380 [Elusimicrobia bacterium]|nr:hypothetical protein [Elusimicrobiota bacterium]
MAEQEIRYAVLLRKPEQLAFPALAEILARRRGCPTLDAMASARSCWGILEQDREEAAAKDLAAALTAAGLEALALPQNLLEELPAAQAAAKADLDQRVFFSDSGEALPAAAPVLLCAAIIKRTVTQTIKVQKDIGLAQKALQVGLIMASGLPIRTASMRKEEGKVVASTELRGLLDLVFVEPDRRLRVVSDDFDYSCLKDKKTFDSLSNFRLLARRLAGFWPEAGRSRGLRFILENQPQREMGYESPVDLERESRWLLTLKALRV